MLSHFLSLLDDRQKNEFTALTAPHAIQAYLDSLPYNIQDTNFSPLRVLQERTAHCLEGALFSALALRFLGYPSVVIDMLPEPGTDDDHVIAIYRRNGGWGAIGKSNYWCLRYREAVYRSVRELVMSYFEVYFNLNRLKNMRNYTVPLNLARFDHLEWMWNDSGVAQVYARVLSQRKIPVLTTEMIASLSLMDPPAYEAGMLGVDPAGLWKGNNP